MCERCQQLRCHQRCDVISRHASSRMLSQYLCHVFAPLYLWHVVVVCTCSTQMLRCGCFAAQVLRCVSALPCMLQSSVRSLLDCLLQRHQLKSPVASYPRILLPCAVYSGTSTYICYRAGVAHSSHPVLICSMRFPDTCYYFFLMRRYAMCVPCVWLITSLRAYLVSYFTVQISLSAP